MIAQMDSELFDWLVSAARFGGGFVSSIANAGLRADAVNYPLIRDVLLVMKQRYPEYGVRSAPEDLKAEAADLPTWSNE